MLRMAFGKASISDRPTSRMKPARQTRPTSRAASSRKRAIVFVARAHPRWLDDDRLDPAAPRTFETRRVGRFEITTRSSRRGAVPDRVDQRLQIGAAAGNQHAEAAVHDRLT